MKYCHNILKSLKYTLPFLLAFVLIFFLLGKVHAQYDGDLDTSFASGHVAGADEQVTGSAVQEDGKILLIGYFQKYNNEAQKYIARLNTDGSLDTSFTQAGTSFNDNLLAIALQSDGKILVAGSFTEYNGTSVSHIARLNSDGSLDTTFGTVGTGFDGGIEEITLQTDGKILVAGSFTTYNGTARKYLARLDSVGNLDASFVLSGTGLNSDGYIGALEVQDDGKIMIGGSFTSYNGTSISRLARLNSDGTLDASFVQTGMGFNGTVYAIAIQEDDKILVGGYFTAYDITYKPYLIRFNTDGSPDATFEQTGTGLDSGVRTISILSNGKILVGGDFFNYNGEAKTHFLRLNADGTLDSSFLENSVGFNAASIWTTSLLNDGRIFVGGWFNSYGGKAYLHAVIIGSDGELDPDFEYGTGLSYKAYVVKTQSDGKILVGGGFEIYDNQPAQHFVRLNSDGSLDTSFTQTGTGLNDDVYAIDVQSDGKILLGGNFTMYNGVATPHLVRLNSDGSLDTTFTQYGDGISGYILSICTQEDGKILVAGAFDYYDEANIGFIARLNEDGSLDSSFMGDGEGVNSSVMSMVLQDDGKIVLGGYFEQYYHDSNTTEVRQLIRLNTDGTLDTSFSEAGGDGLNEDGWVLSVAIQPDDKILVGGAFEQYDGTDANYLARLNSDGSLDTSFTQTGTGIDFWVELIKPQDDGKILISGGFLSYNGTSSPYLARLNTDGSLDTTFVQSGEGLNNYVLSIALQDDGKIILAGSFSFYDTTPVAYLARLNVHHPPLAPSILKTNGLTNPTGVSSLYPSFTTLVSDAKLTDTMISYQVQVSTSSTFTSGSTVWDSGKQTFASPVTSGNTTSSIIYAGNALTTNGTKYYWRMKVWDSLDAESDWSSTNTFTMTNNSLSAPAGLTVSPSAYTNSNSFNLSWTSGNTRTVSYEYKTGASGSSWIPTSANSMSILAYKGGQNTVQIRGVDNAGNKSSSSTVSYYYDDVSPLAPTNLTVTPTGTSITNSFSFSWSGATDTYSGVYGYEYRTGDNITWTSTTTTTANEFQAEKEGENIFYVRTIDKAGNVSSPGTISFYYSSSDSVEEVSSDISFVREGQTTSIQNDTVSVKSGEIVTVSIPVEDIVVEGDDITQVYVEIDGIKTPLTLNDAKDAYVARLTIPTGKVRGSILATKQVVEYTSGQQSVKGVSIIVDPYGYVYSVLNGNEQRLEGADVYLYNYENGNKTLVSFTDETPNPQQTNSDGEYSFFIPSGFYQISVSLAGYKTYESSIFEVKDGAVVMNIELEKNINWGLYLISGGAFLITGTVFVIVLVKRRKS